MHGASSVSKSAGPAGELDALFTRMRERLYPETIPVLASYWLKTVCNAGHNAAWWKELTHLIEKAADDPEWQGIARQSLVEIREWLATNQPPSGKSAPAPARRSGPFRENLRREWLAPYMCRLLNEWLPAEIAQLLVGEWESAGLQEEGVPVLATGLALERLLLRERLSEETLEMLLWPDTLSPQYIYPADAEVLADVVLARLGRTRAPAPPVMPAILAGMAADSDLPADYAERVRLASVVRGSDGDELRVPIPAEQAFEILKGDPVRIGSVIVTMDGRCWQSARLESGEQHAVVYKSSGRLRIDNSKDHAMLYVPWPETPLHWEGGVHLQGPFQIFGREWRTASWDTDGEQTMLRLVFSRPLSAEAVEAEAEPLPPRSRPASVDMAWAAMEAALAASLRQESRDAIEQLHHSDLIPLGRAVYRLSELVLGARQANREAIEVQLNAVRYLESAIAPAYGLFPWRILPGAVQSGLLKNGGPEIHEVFDGAPSRVKNVPPRAA